MPSASIGDDSVAVVVVTHNSSDVVEGLVGSLPAGMAEVSWHLVVADNASADDSLAVLRGCAPDATVVALPDNRGYAAGINAAVAAAPAHTAVLVLNPDVRLAPGASRSCSPSCDAPGPASSSPGSTTRPET